jgi:hypothetical protein
LRRLASWCARQKPIAGEDLFGAFEETVALLADAAEVSRDPVMWLSAIAMVSRRRADEQVRQRMDASPQRGAQWLTRPEAANVLECSIALVRKFEARGWLRPRVEHRGASKLHLFARREVLSLARERAARNVQRSKHRTAPPVDREDN